MAALQVHPDVAYLVDAPHPQAPLVITFGFVSWDELPIFDFVRRLRKLEIAREQPLNWILVRDPANLWYQHGVPGLGRGVDEVAVALRSLIAQLQPNSLSTLGQSMGGYAAVLFGALLNADHILAFGPLSYLRSDWARRDGDTRWLASMEKLDQFPPAQRYDDLPSLLATLPRMPVVHLLYGTGLEADLQLTNYDPLHLARFAKVPGVEIHKVPEAGHAVTEWLVKMKRMDGVLEHLLLPGRPHMTGAPYIDLSGSPSHPDYRRIDQGWRSWIAENLALDASREQLLGDLVSFGFHPGEAQSEIDRAFRSPYLQAAARLAARIPRSSEPG